MKSFSGVSFDAPECGWMLTRDFPAIHLGIRTMRRSDEHYE
jgi:hypothetical protein